MAQDDPFGTAHPQSAVGNSLEPLASQVISMLCERQSPVPTGARQIVIDFLVRSVTSRNGFDPGLVMDELRGYRLTVDMIIDVYVPRVAAELGALWNTSDIDFASVTIGSLRLQSLLIEATAFVDPVSARDAPLALVVVPEGEQHFLGSSVVAAQMRRLGCEVSLSIAERPKDVINRVLYDQPDMVLLSCAQLAGLETIARTARKIRSAAEPAPILALGGAVRGDIESIRTKTGVDLVTKSAKDVVGFYMKRHKALSQR